MSDLIDKQAAIDAIGEKSDEIYKTKQKGATYPHDDFFQGMAYAEDVVKRLPSAQPEPLKIDLSGCSKEDWERFRKEWANIPMTVLPEQRTGHWILDRSGAYCCSECMEPCAGYVMMKPRDKFCKMCGSRNEVTE